MPPVGMRAASTGGTPPPTQSRLSRLCSTTSGVGNGQITVAKDRERPSMGQSRSRGSRGRFVPFAGRRSLAVAVVELAGQPGCFDQPAPAFMAAALFGNCFAAGKGAVLATVRDRPLPCLSLQLAPSKSAAWLTGRPPLSPVFRLRCPDPGGLARFRPRLRPPAWPSSRCGVPNLAHQQFVGTDQRERRPSGDHPAYRRRLGDGDVGGEARHTAHRQKCPRQQAAPGSLARVGQ